MEPVKESVDFLILGGGLAGLTAAYELLKRGYSVVVVEQHAHVGGLARTIEREQFCFDLGGHRFHNNNLSITKWLIFGRIHEPKNWSAAMLPAPHLTSLCVEIFASPHETTWQLPDQTLIAQTVTELERLQLIQPNALRKGWVTRLPHPYPIYRVGYQQQLAAAKQALTTFSNLHLVGHTGSFHYMNSDGVVEDVFRFLETLQLPTPAVAPLPSTIGRWI